jgi:hypothetical protein
MHTYWTYNSVKEAALKCRTVTEFSKKFSGAVKYAKRHGIFKELTGHFESFKWDEASIREFALTCDSLVQFTKNKAVRDFAIKHGIFDEVTSHMKKNKIWNHELVYNIASKYNLRVRFIEEQRGACDYAKRHGIYEDVCSHMDKKKYWSYDEVKELASKCETRWEFQKKYRKAYRTAVRNNYLEEICSHMRVVGNKNKRTIYEIRFFNIKKCYIGLTHDTKERRNSHEKYSSNRNVRKLIESNEPYEWFEDKCYYDENIVAKIEQERIDLRKKEGWVILNVVKGGALGGFKKNMVIVEQPPKVIFLWGLENSVAEASKYKCRNDLQLACKGAYNYLLKHKRLDKYFPTKSRNLTHEIVREIALKFDRKEEFKKADSAAATYAVKHKIFDKICSHMPKRAKRRWAKKPNHANTNS